MPHNNHKDRHAKLKKELEAKQNKAKELDKKINFLTKDELRRKRTSRLIQTGILAEKYFETSHLDREDVEELFKMFSKYINTNKPNKFKK